eukprot:scaffold24900_cov132-Isochrysis_galbana.AAC.10
MEFGQFLDLELRDVSLLEAELEAGDHHIRHIRIYGGSDKAVHCVIALFHRPPATHPVEGLHHDALVKAVRVREEATVAERVIAKGCVSPEGWFD